MNRKERLEKILKDHFPKWSHLDLEDESHNHSRGQETHYKLLFVHESFEGLSRIQRHRKVLSLFKSEMDQGLHSVSLKLLAPTEFTPESSGFETPSCQGAKPKKL